MLYSVLWRYENNERVHRVRGLTRDTVVELLRLLREDRSFNTECNRTYISIQDETHKEVAIESVVNDTRYLTQWVEPEQTVEG